MPDLFVNCCIYLRPLEKRIQRLSTTRLQSLMESAGGLSKKRCSFKLDRTTVEAKRVAVDTVRAVWVCDTCLHATYRMTTFDLKNICNFIT